MKRLAWVALATVSILVGGAAKMTWAAGDGPVPCPTVPHHRPLGVNLPRPRPLGGPLSMAMADSFSLDGSILGPFSPFSNNGMGRGGRLVGGGCPFPFPLLEMEPKGQTPRPPRTWGPKPIFVEGLPKTILSR